MDGEVVQFDYDLFVSAPMDALADDGTRVSIRDEVIGILETLKKECALSRVFYAGYQAARSEDFDLPVIALRKNIQRIRASARMMLIYPENVPTSCLIEVGMALGLGKPSVWFVKKGVKLPFLMRGVKGSMRIQGVGDLSVYEFDDFPQIVHFIKDHKLDLFECG